MKFNLTVLLRCTICVLSSAGPAFASDAPPRLPALPNKNFQVTDFGALGDGKTRSRQGFQMAIEFCAQYGGGHVIVPEGVYQLSGPIHLVSGVDLHLEDGAVMIFSRQFDAYPLMVTNFEGLNTVNRTAFISAKNVKNVSITGRGVIEGNGDAWRQVRKASVTDQQWNRFVQSGGAVDPVAQMWWPSKAAMDGYADLQTFRRKAAEPVIQDYAKYGELLRPDLVMFDNCQNAMLDGPTFRNAPCWTLHCFLCNELTVHHVTVDNPRYGANTDGIDVDSCRDVLITDSTFNAGDDDICLKSGRDESGRRLGRPTENVTITRCTIGAGHGGIALGSEMSGGIRHVRISQCTMAGTNAGFRVKTTRGRGNIIEDVEISDLTMSNIQQNAIDFGMFYGDKQPAATQPVNEGTPRLRGFHFSNITCRSARTAFDFRGLQEMPLEDLTMENFDITAQQGGRINDAKNITLKNVHIHAKSNVDIERVAGLTADDVSGIDR